MCNNYDDYYKRFVETDEPDPIHLLVRIEFFVKETNKWGQYKKQKDLKDLGKPYEEVPIQVPYSWQITSPQSRGSEEGADVIHYPKAISTQFGPQLAYLDTLAEVFPYIQARVQKIRSKAPHSPIGLKIRLESDDTRKWHENVATDVMRLIEAKRRKQSVTHFNFTGTQFGSNVFKNDFLAVAKLYNTLFKDVEQLGMTYQ